MKTDEEGDGALEKEFCFSGKRAWNQVNQNEFSVLVRQEGNQREEQTKQAGLFQLNHQLNGLHLYSNTLKMSLKATVQMHKHLCTCLITTFG